MAIANALQLEGRSTPMPSLRALSLSVDVLAYSVFTADTLRYAVTLTFDLEHLPYIGCAIWSNTVPNLSEIEQSVVELFDLNINFDHDLKHI